MCSLNYFVPFPSAATSNTSPFSAFHCFKRFIKHRWLSLAYQGCQSNSAKSLQRTGVPVHQTIAGKRYGQPSPKLFVLNGDHSHRVEHAEVRTTQCSPLLNAHYHTSLPPPPLLAEWMGMLRVTARPSARPGVPCHTSRFPGFVTKTLGCIG